MWECELDSSRFWLTRWTDCYEEDGISYRWGPVEQILVCLTLILLTWGIWWAPNNASEWQMGFDPAFNGLKLLIHLVFFFNHERIIIRLLLPSSFSLGYDIIMEKYWQFFPKQQPRIQLLFIIQFIYNGPSGFIVGIKMLQVSDNTN